MNLHAIVGPVISSVNPMTTVSIQLSTGPGAIQADGSVTPTFAPAFQAQAQVQPLTFRDIQQIDGLNLQGVRRAIYIFGQVDGLVRDTNKGGDLITFPDGTVWLVALVLEAWVESGWCKAAITLQNGS